MGKDNTMMWVIGAGLVGYLLAPQEIKDKIGGTIGTITERVTEVIPFPTGGGGIPSISNILGGGEGGLFGGAGFGWPTDTFDWKSYIDNLLGGGGEGGGEGETVGPPSEGGGLLFPTPQPQPSLGITEGWDIEGIRQKLGLGAGVVGGLAPAWLTKFAPPLVTKGILQVLSRAVPALAVKGGVRVAAAAVPWLGWGYLAADIGVTAYELISGKNIAGPWLGWGEFFNPERDESTQQIDEQVIAREGIRTTRSESPSKPTPETEGVEKGETILTGGTPMEQLRTRQYLASRELTSKEIAMYAI